MYPLLLVFADCENDLTIVRCDKTPNFITNHYTITPKKMQEILKYFPCKKGPFSCPFIALSDLSAITRANIVGDGVLDVPKRKATAQRCAVAF